MADISTFHHLMIGFGIVLSPVNLLYCTLGVVIGTLIGVLPGIGPLATIAMLLPITFNLPAVTALIMLAGIYYGAQYGGSTTSILVNLPGESSSVITCLDGYAMARQGRAGPALSISAIGSFFAGCAATVVMALFAPTLASIAFNFGPAEYFSLMVLGLVGAIVLSRGSLIKAIAMMIFGLLLGLVGTDINSGVQRFTFGLSSLFDGVDFIVVAMGMFAFSEMITQLETKEKRTFFTSRLKMTLPTRQDLKASWKAVIRGTGLGVILGTLPGGGPVLSSFAAYTVEKRIARDPSRFGKGAIEGVAAPESANNAAAQVSFVPMLTLGVPTTATMALMLGALIIHGIPPGPELITRQPDLFWGVIASMWVGNLILLVLNLPLVGVWVRLLTIPYRLLYPAILMFCCIGVYGVSNSSFDVILTAGFGLLGYVFSKLKCDPVPLILGLILGSRMEENLRRALILSRGNPKIFFTEPISLFMLLLAAFLLVLVIAPSMRRKREEAFQE